MSRLKQVEMSWLWFCLEVILVTYIVSTGLKWLFGCYIIGLTGGIGCGKSTFVRQVIQRTATNQAKPHVIDLDEISKQVVEKGLPALEELRLCFGEDIINPETGELDRDKLGSLVFGDKVQLSKLNGIMTRYILWELMYQILNSFFIDFHEYIILDAPLLFETKLSWVCSETVCIVATEKEQLTRVLKRNPQLDEKQIEQRIASQMPTSIKAKLATHVIANTSDVTEQGLGDQAEAWWRENLAKRQRFWIPSLMSVSSALCNIIAICIMWGLLRILL